MTMSISLSRLDPSGADRQSLINFFTSTTFPFHVHSEQWTVAKVEELIDSGAFRNAENEAFWLRHDTLGVIGYVRLEDLADDTPMFDLRLASEFRGRGLGVGCLRAVTDHVFMTMDVDRFEGHTRDDNVAMRSTLIRAGWSKEAHYRRAWPVKGQMSRDSVAYAILREEWKSGSSVDVHWHDLPMFTPQVGEDVNYTSNSVPRGHGARRSPSFGGLDGIYTGPGHPAPECAVLCSCRIRPARWQADRPGTCRQRFRFDRVPTGCARPPGAPSPRCRPATRHPCSDAV